ncbi:hypothetical protein DPEC_G00362240 [Dallia pectoralis]|nr:hypothetical protein DPEC_G00362240 [Dallia pectoralis]
MSSSRAALLPQSSPREMVGGGGRQTRHQIVVKAGPPPTCTSCENTPMRRLQGRREVLPLSAALEVNSVAAKTASSSGSDMWLSGDAGYCSFKRRWVEKCREMLNTIKTQKSAAGNTT